MAFHSSSIILLILGIANRALRPTLGVVDPEHLVTMPERVAAYSGIDVLWYVASLK